MLQIPRKSLKKCLNLKKTSSFINLNKNYHKIQSEEKTIGLPKCSKTIRKEFLDYFLDLDHKFIPSSRVAPIFDSSVAFTNAGMNQFKGIFLDELKSPSPRVVNHQKCVRVGGKHNDLKAVGMDNYHHTFFEMLGNWSFGDYGRREACSYAWGLLTGPFSIPKDRLYVTYFSGDSTLPPDHETKEIWLSLGLHPSHILPSGLQDNFWEMSVTGPCGLCTEIHVNTSPSSSSSPPNPSNLKELWNIVFIEHQRLQDTSIQPLNTHHVDTGMGFERLVAVLQGKDSNYDTDLFQPIFEGIRRSYGGPEYQGRFNEADKEGIDTGYRVLADHARMVTICLADGMIPEENHKLRRVMRTAINIGIDVFKKYKILHDVCGHVADTLGDVYPEISDNLRHIQTIVEYEEELLKSLKMSSRKMWGDLVRERPELGRISDPYASGLVQGYRELQKGLEGCKRVGGGGKMPGELSFKLYDTYGLDPDVIEELAEVEGVKFDRGEFEGFMEGARVRSRMGVGGVGVNRRGVSEESEKWLARGGGTNDGLKYGAGGEVEAKVLGILVDGELLSENTLHINSSLENKQIGVILDKTSFYTPEGGQLSDKGHFTMKNLVFNISEVEKVQNYVIHFGNFDLSNLKDGISQLSINDEIKLFLDENHRISMMRHHTATHLLNSALRKIFPAISQRGSVVKHDNLIFQFSAYGKIISPEDIKSIEQLINDCIDAQVPVKTKIVDSIEFNCERNLILVPGTIYPEKNLRIVEIDGNHLKSKEACCGTHVHNTSALNHFRIIEVTSKGSSSRTIKAVAGPQARDLPLTVSENLLKIPPVTPEDSKDANKKREMVEDFMRTEINYAISNTNENFVVHCLPLSSIEVESIPLQKAVELCPEKPIFIIAKGKRKVRARCFVPENFVTKEFNAELWMKSMNKILQSTIGHFEDDNPLLTSHTRVFKLPKAEIDSRVEESIQEAKNFALKNCKKS